MLLFNELPTIYDKVNYVFQILDVSVATVGIIFNTLTFLVLSRKRFSSIGFSFYMRCKSVSDSFILLHSYRRFSAFMFNADIDLTSSAACIFLEYSIYVASAVCLFSLRFNGLDRMLSIVYPNRFGFIKKRYFQVSAMFLVLVYGVAVYIQLPLFTRLININGTLSCVLINADVGRIMPTIALINLFIGSGCINNILTGVTVTFIWRSRKRFSSSNNNATAIRDRKFAINSIVLDIMYFVCKTPVLVTIACSFSPARNRQVMMMMFTVCAFIYILESASSFFINYSVNSMFKDEVKRMFGLSAGKVDMNSSMLGSQAARHRVNIETRNL